MAKDKCVICGCETPYEESTHIDLRENYIVGIGQCCLNCLKPKTSEILNSMYEKTILGQDVVIVNYKDIINRPNDSDLGNFVRRLYNTAKNGK
jgi:hypothetical protein